MVDPLQLSATIGTIYEAALDPTRWYDALRVTVQFVGSERGLMGITNTVTGQLDIAQTYALDPDLMERWTREYQSVDPWADGMPVMIEGECGRGSDIISYEALERIPAFREIAVPVGAFDTCWATLASNRLRVGFLSAFQGEDQGIFSLEAVERMAILAPHLVRTARVHTHLAELRRSQQALAGALDELTFGLVTLTQDSRVLTLNRRAESLFDRGGALRLQSHQVCTQDPANSRRLHALVRDASETALGISSKGGGVLALRTGDDLAAPLTATIAPISRRVDDPFGADPRGSATVLMIVTQPGQPLEVPEGALNEIFGLSRSEAQLALGLAEGLSLAEYADQARIAIGTARWTLKNVQSKTGVSRQASLVALIHRSLAPLVTRGNDD